MAAAKLNVLHLHLSDFGGFRVASPTYPALTATLLDKHGARLYWLYAGLGLGLDPPHTHTHTHTRRVT